MSSAFAIANVQHSLMALKEEIPPNEWCDTPLPVIAAPGWWLEDVRKELGGEPGYEPSEIHGCPVLRCIELSEPVLINHDGKRYPILPAWMRARQAADTEDGAA